MICSAWFVLLVFDAFNTCRHSPMDYIFGFFEGTTETSRWLFAYLGKIVLMGFLQMLPSLAATWIFHHIHILRYLYLTTLPKKVVLLQRNDFLWHPFDQYKTYNAYHGNGGNADLPYYCLFFALVSRAASRNSTFQNSQLKCRHQFPNYV